MFLLSPRSNGSAIASGRPRVVQLCARLPIGDVERVVARLAELMPAAGYDTEIWCLEEADRLGRELVANGCRVLEFGRTKRCEPALFFRLARLLHARQVDLLHCHDELSWFYGALAARLSRRPIRVVVTIHARRYRIAWRHLIKQRFLTRTTASIVSTSEFLRRRLIDELRIMPTRVLTVHNGVRVETGRPSTRAEQSKARASLGIGGGGPVVCTVADTAPLEAVGLAIDALAAAKQRIANLTLAAICDVRYHDRLKDYASALGVLDSVILTGSNRHVRHLMAAFDVYMSTSPCDGISPAMLEAMAVGLPVIAADAGPVAEIIRPRETGVLAASRCPKAFAHELLRVLRDDVLRARVAKGARRAVIERYSVERMVSEYGRLYQNLLIFSRSSCLARRAP